MSPPTAELDAAIMAAATLIEFAGTFFVMAGVVRAVTCLCCRRGDVLGVVIARIALAESVVAALGFKTAATLLKTLELRSWHAIALFAAVLALRTFVKLALQWESRQLRGETLRFVTENASE